ncbi:hypothetical protein GUITHDRAFT_134019 [Guillardia theta CCMP2712]|uniref:Uncharacterized protein n=1 Tax=Guillardia theta (strain CCMP2712) TaxID=905079 RepID=L1JVK3_GUITC|nr:hypothetical protein GUITHDRAFT_134019 [Guillardia theta CCMP2712]EKX52329.1 hypothetical protein GUITHDRAFT_134019 [Guillardia theta CCMP2712]|eukprot:XP_005839309.1 hypothetical protein GUITHDRAFT_134019 [Guillardia theta CCMP2712]
MTSGGPSLFLLSLLLLVLVCKDAEAATCLCWNSRVSLAQGRWVAEGSATLWCVAVCGGHGKHARPASNSSLRGVCGDSLPCVGPAACELETERLSGYTIGEEQSCKSNPHCAWRNNNDSCSCTFIGCQCGSPAANATSSSSFSQQTMLFVSLPIVFGVSCLCCSLCAYACRSRIYKLSDVALPRVFTRMMAEKSEEEGAESAGREEEEEEEAQGKQLKEAPRGEWLVKVLVEKAFNLPCSDGAYRDSKFLGSSDAYVDEGGEGNAGPVGEVLL